MSGVEIKCNYDELKGEITGHDSGHFVQISFG
jgi:hypothetical protein